MAIREAREKFHQNCQVGYKAHPLGYMGVNLGIPTPARLEARARARARARMLAKNHVPARLQQPSTNYIATKCGGRGGRGGECTTRQSKSKEGVGGLGSSPSQTGRLEVPKLFQLGKGV
jgi:hypothetical protein